MNAFEDDNSTNLKYESETEKFNQTLYEFTLSGLSLVLKNCKSKNPEARSLTETRLYSLYFDA
jgi:hypothetical protein